MIGSDGWLQGRENVNLARPADFENGAAAVAHVEILFGIERDAGGHAHSFDVHRCGTRRRDLIDDTVIAAGDIERARFVKSEAGGVHQIRHERLGSVVQVDFVD